MSNHITQFHPYPGRHRGRILPFAGAAGCTGSIG
jgi:hypothetical protein